MYVRILLTKVLLNSQHISFAFKIYEKYYSHDLYVIIMKL